MAGYGTDAEFQTWLTAKGRVLPADAPAVAALRERGSVYIDGLYYRRFPGYPTGGAAQERQWPRSGAADRWGNDIASDDVPPRVVEASFEAAWIEATSPGALSATYTPGQNKVLTEVGNIKWTVVGDASGDDAMWLVSTVIDGILGPLLMPRDIPAILVV
jgi:hypothetical protein